MLYFSLGGSDWTGKWQGGTGSDSCTPRSQWGKWTMLMFNEWLELLCQWRHQLCKLHNKQINPLTHCCHRLKAKAAIFAAILFHLVISDLDVLGIFVYVLFCLSVHLDEIFASPFHYPPDLLCCFLVQANWTCHLAKCNCWKLICSVQLSWISFACALWGVFVVAGAVVSYRRASQGEWAQQGFGSCRFNQRLTPQKIPSLNTILLSSILSAIKIVVDSRVHVLVEVSRDIHLLPGKNHLGCFQASQIPSVHLSRFVANSQYGEQLINPLQFLYPTITPPRHFVTKPTSFCVLSSYFRQQSWERLHEFYMNINIVPFLFGITMKVEHRAVTMLTFKSQVWLENAGGWVI